MAPLLQVFSQITSRGVAALALTLGLSPAAWSADLFVDPVLGSDVTGTGTASAPWKTITYTVAQMPAGGNDIFLSAGDYSEASGEVFPIALSAGEQLSFNGAGQGATNIVGNGTSPSFSIGAIPSVFPSQEISISVHNLTFENSGIYYANGSSLAEVLVDDTHFNNVVWTGIVVSSSSGGFGSAVIRDSVFSNCGWGVSASAWASTTKVNLFDSVISNCGTGALADGGGNPFGPGYATITMTRCEVRACQKGSQGIGNDFDFLGIGAIHFVDSLITGNSIGFEGYDFSDLFLNSSTMAGNTEGVVVSAFQPASTYLSFLGSILWGNTFDVLSANVNQAQYSNVPAGIRGVGVTHVDPLFVDSAMGDFHLLSTSPLIDMGHPTYMAGQEWESDLDPRVVDGDLDGTKRVDMGFDEYNPAQLALTTGTSINSTITLDTTGLAGGAYILAIGFGVAQVDLGPAGTVLIDPIGAVKLPAAPLPGSDSFAVPNVSALIGIDLHAQALTVLGPLAHLSNRIDLTIEP